MSFWTTASLTLMDDDDFRRVLEFVKPDESDTEPQKDEEYRQVMDFLDNLQRPERCAWMTKHCTRLYVDFGAEPQKKELSWSGRNAQGGYACDIAELVVAQFPDIEFRISSICPDFGDYKFGVSENGKVKWIELSKDALEMIEWGIDVDPYTGPTPENLEELNQRRRARVQEMIDLGVDISIDTWPPTEEQFLEEYRLRSRGDEQSLKHRIWDDSDDFVFNDEDVLSMIAEEYADIGLSKEELLTAGNEGMAKAHEYYDDKEHGSCFYAYADSWVRQAIFQAMGAKLTKSTDENYKDLHQHIQEIVQEMIDLGVHISPDTWPPTKEQIDEDYRLRYAKNTESKTDNHSHEDNPDLPF